MTKTQDQPVVMVSVPSDLLTKACQLLGELQAKHSAAVYVELLACQPAEPAAT